MTGVAAHRFHIGDRAGWQRGTHDRTSGSQDAGLRLRHADGGSMAPDSEDESLGGLILPRGLALDEEYRLFLARSDGRVCAFEGARIGERFVPILRLPEGWSDGSVRPRIAVASGWLLVAHTREARLLAFRLDDDASSPSAPREVTLVARGEGSSAGAPLDIAASAQGFVVLEPGSRSRLWRIDGSTLRATRIRSVPIDAWSRIALTSSGDFVLVRGTNFNRFSQDGTKIDETDDPSALRHEFEGPWIRCDEKLRFLIPDFLWEPFQRRPDPGGIALYPDDPHGKNDAIAVKSGRRWPAAKPEKVLFDLEGRELPLDLAEPRARLLYAATDGGPAGTWTSRRLDSEIYRCSWGRIDVEVRYMPRGTRIVVRTYATDDPGTDEDHFDDELWTECLSISRAELDQISSPNEPQTIDALAGGRDRLQGRYLWLRLEFDGDGYRSPVVRTVTVSCPDGSYSQYLPGVYKAERASRVLLERFLAVPQTEWDELERRVNSMPDMLDPARVPDGPMLDFLASWIDAPVDVAWSDQGARRLLEATRANANRRGTPAALRAMVTALVQPDEYATDTESDWPPVVVEGYQDRDLVVLDASGRLGPRARLAQSLIDDAWIVGVTSRPDHARLTADTIPEDRVFQRYAFRFDVYIPAEWIRAREQRRRLISLLERERPAHVAFRVRPIRGAIRVGVQSRVGVDTLIGDAPRTLLTAEDPDESGVGSHLGIDTVLAPTAKYPQAFPVRRPEATP